MSRWPSVTNNAVCAVEPVTIALMAWVVPWMKVSARARKPFNVSPCAAAASCRASRTPLTGSSGTVEDLNSVIAPSSSSTTRSVKVPPVSVANRMALVLESKRCRTPRDRRGKGHRLAQLEVELHRDRLQDGMNRSAVGIGHDMPGAEGRSPNGNNAAADQNQCANRHIRLV